MHPWATGGTTSLANGVLLCGHHHRLVEHGDWQISLTAEGTPEFRPPPWTDPDQRPQRNHQHTPAAGPDPPIPRTG
ncbi:MAG: hypothetical protein ACJ73E_12265 [Mycobacteriales bacterium]